MGKIEGTSKDNQGAYFVMFDPENRLMQADINLQFKEPNVSLVRNLTNGFEGNLKSRCTDYNESAYSANYEGVPDKNVTVAINAGIDNYLIRITQRKLTVSSPVLDSFKKNIKEIIKMIQKYHSDFHEDSLETLLDEKIKEAETKVPNSGF